MDNRPVVPSAKAEDPRHTSGASPAQIVQDLPRLIERMHRRFLDVVRFELSRQGVQDISPVQAMMLSNIGNEEISVRDLVERGYYLGSNASYNLKHLVDGGYVDRRAAARDRRAARLTLSAKGKKILEALAHLNTSLAEPLMGEVKDIEAAWRILRKLERRWSDAIRFQDDSGSKDDDL
jgi:DNA-binding MarR family transcriptional regulator